MKTLCAVLLLALPAFSTTTVTGNIKNLQGGAVGTSNNAIVRFILRGTGNAQPVIAGTGALAPTSANGIWYTDIPADSNGNVSGTIYSTRNSAGTGAGDITVNGSGTAVWYDMVIVVNGMQGPATSIHAKSGATLDISNVTPITTTPVVTAPTGDSTYLRLDGGNGPITGGFTAQGNNTFTGSNTFSGPFTLAGTSSILSTTGSFNVSDFDGFYIGTGSKYNTLSTMDTAMNTDQPSKPATGLIPPSYIYSGTDCPPNITTNHIFFDYRSGGRTGSGTSSFGPCLNNTIQYNYKTSGLTDSMERSEMSRSAVDATGAIVNAYILTHLNGATATNGTVDGASTEAQVNGTLSGSIGALTGDEAVATVTSTGGTVPVASGVLGYCFSTGGSTTAITDCRGLWGRGGKGTISGAQPTNSYGGYFSTQQGVASGRQYAAAFEGLAIAMYDTTGGLNLGGIDLEDTDHSTHRGIYVAADHTTNYRAVNTAGAFLISQDGTQNLRITNGGPTFTSNLTPATAGGGDIGSTALPVSAAIIGNAATNNIILTGSATASRTQTLQDATGTVPLIIASGTSALGTGAISATTCASVVTTAATNTLSTDTISWAFNAAPSTAYTSGVHVLAYVTSGNVNFLVCNPTAGSLTPAAATLNWRVIR